VANAVLAACATSAFRQGVSPPAGRKVTAPSLWRCPGQLWET
jgi:hypothetical protein